MIYVNNKSGFLICFYRAEPAAGDGAALLKNAPPNPAKWFPIDGISLGIATLQAITA